MVFAVAWREEMSKILFKAGSRRMTRERREREREETEAARGRRMVPKKMASLVV